MKHKKMAIIALLVGIGLLGVVLAARSRASLFPSLKPDAAQPPAGETAEAVALACTGRVEGAGEAISIGAGIDGVIAEVRVKEGQQVAAGDILVVIERQELRGELSEAQATVERAKASRARLERGGRDDEAARAAAATQAAAAVVKQAQARYERFERLFAEGVISADTRDEAFKEVEVARATLRAAQRNEEVVRAEPLPEELSRAEAEIRAAEAHVRALAERLKKCDVRAPVRGTILRLNMKAGEAYSTVTPQPIITMADTSNFRVRAEVDERDVSGVYLGQRVLITGDALQSQRITGSVSRISPQMGRKKVRTGDPAEKSDRDVLEVLIDIEEKDLTLYVGLRVTAQFMGRQPALDAR